MKVRNIVCCLLLSLFVSYGFTQEEVDSICDRGIVTINLTNYSTDQLFKKRCTFEPYVSTTLNITEIPRTVSFLILQMHVYEYNVTLSYDEEHLEKISNKSVFGSNIGLYIPNNDNRSVQMFSMNKNVKKVEALVVISLYDDKAPIPGGCNMEFDVKYAPYQKLTLGNELITVDFQPSSMPTIANNPSNCNKNPLRYDVYQMYLSKQDFSVESYFEGISKMLNVKDIISHGNKIPASASYSPMRRIYASYRGTGSVYAVVVSYDDHSASYVPTFSYSCKPVLDESSCTYLTGGFEKTVCAFSLIVGLLFVYVGHRRFKVELTVNVYLIGSVIGYIISISAADHPTSTHVGVGLITGLIMVFFVWLLICGCATPDSYRTFITIITFGPLAICIVHFLFSDIGGLLENNWLFTVIAITILILVGVSVSYVPYFIGTAASALFISYAAIVSIDFFAESYSKYIIVNVIRRLTVSGFAVAIRDPPIGAADIILMLFWMIMAAFRVIRWYKWLAIKKERHDFYVHL